MILNMNHWLNIHFHRMLTKFEDLSHFVTITENLLKITSEGDQPIAYASRTFTPGEKNKSVILKELTGQLTISNHIFMEIGL